MSASSEQPSKNSRKRARTENLPPRRTSSRKIKVIVNDSEGEHAHKKWKRDDQNNCPHCDKKLRQKASLERHLKRVHKVDSNPTPGSIKCLETNCNFVSRNMQGFHQHLVDKHQFSIGHEVRNFPNEKDFLDWKVVEETATCSNFVKRRGRKLLIENKPATYYYCNLTRDYESIGNGKRKVKFANVPLARGECTAFMKVYSKSDGFEVQYCKTHYGHKAERNRESPKLEKREFKKQLKGLSLNKSYIKQNIEKPKKICLIRKKEVANLETAYMLSIDEKNHPNSSVNVEEWVDNMKSLEDDNPVLYYKPIRVPDADDNFREQDFVLIIMTSLQARLLRIYGQNGFICMDSTYGKHSHNFKLTSMLIVGDCDKSFPVAFLISNRHDCAVMKKFCAVVKSKVGEISCKVFMSDNAEQFYIAWSSVMSEVENRLLCSWHVDKSWKGRLKLIKSRDLQIGVYRTLKNILEEPDADIFTTLFDKFLTQLLNNPDTQGFGSYLKHVYEPRTKMWAHCYKKHFSILADMHLEAMHNLLKQVYFLGIKAKRLDKCIFMLLKLTRDKQFEYILDIDENSLEEDLDVIQEQHLRSESLNFSHIVCHDEDCWKVKSEVKENVMYLVERKIFIKDAKHCSLHCNECETCIHEFACSCADAVIHATVCSHMHLISRYSKSPGCEENKSNVPVKIEIDTIPVVETFREPEIPVKTIKNNHLNKRKDMVLSQIKALAVLVESVKRVDSLNLISDQINTIYQTVKRLESSCSTST